MVESDEVDGALLVAGDVPNLASILVDYMRRAGFKPRLADDANAIIDLFKNQPVTVMLLDPILPVDDDVRACQTTRCLSDAPVVMVTARAEAIDQLLSMELGGDDSIGKSPSPREILARVKAFLERLEPWPDESVGHGFAIDEQNMSINLDGQQLDLTVSEYTLLHTLVRRPGRVFSRCSLLDQLSPEARDVSDRSIDSHIKNLRKKLAIIRNDQDVIHTVYGVGYKLEIERRRQSTCEFN